MQAIAVTNNTIQTREINSQLFNDFVAWIDRSTTTTRAYITNFKQFLKWLHTACISKPTRGDVICYRQYLIDKGCKPNTITAYIRSIKQFFEWTSVNGYYPNIAANIHAPKVDHNTHKKDCLTAKEVLEIENSIKVEADRKLDAAASSVKDTAGRVQRSTEQGKRLYAMYLLAVTAGLRTIEIHRANIKDLETKGEQTWLYIWGKGRTEPDQKKPIAKEVAAAINEYLESRTDRPAGNSPLFAATGNRSAGQRIATTTISTMLKRAMQEAGFNSERLTAHSLRHTAGTAVQEITGDLFQTQKYMRHANPATTEIYLHNETEKQEAHTAELLYNLYHGNQEQDSRTELESKLAKLSPAQIEQLTKLAAAMV